MNDKLFKVLIPAKLIEMGFVEDNDGTEDPRGFEWSIKNEKFDLWVDPWCDVHLARINPNTDGIKLKIDDLYELKCVVDWISEEEPIKERALKLVEATKGNFYCDKCKGITQGSLLCENVSCPNMPCCDKPRDKCGCVGDKSSPEKLK